MFQSLSENLYLSICSLENILKCAIEKLEMKVLKY